LKEGQLLAVGDVRVSFMILKNSSIQIECAQNGKLEVRKIFDKKNSPIYVGRSDKCNMMFKANSFSRFQFTLIYEKDNWIIFDGDSKKPSTNGTWSMLKDETEIKNNMVIKVSEISLKAKLQSNI